MKKTVKFLSLLVIFVFSVFALSACTNDEKTPLDAPSSLQVENNILTWGEVNGAKKYIVSINGTEFEVEGTSFDLSTFDSGVLQLQIKVKAISSVINRTDSVFSTVIHYERTIEIHDVEGLKQAIALFLMQEENYEEEVAENLANSFVDYTLIPLNEYVGLSYQRLYSFYTLGYGLNLSENPFEIMTILGTDDFTVEELAKLTRGIMIVMLESLPLHDPQEYQQQIEQLQQEYDNAIATMLPYQQTLDAAFEAYKESSHYELNQLIFRVEEEEKAIYDRIYQYLYDYHHFPYWDVEYPIYQYISSLKADDSGDIEYLESLYYWLVDIKEDALEIVQKEAQIDYINMHINSLPQEELVSFNIYMEARNQYEMKADEINYDIIVKNHPLLIDQLTNKQKHLQAEWNLFDQLLDYLKENNQSIEDSILTFIELSTNFYEDNFELLREIMESEYLTPAEMITLRNELVASIFDSGLLPSKEEVTTALNTLKDIAYIYVEVYFDIFEEEIGVSLEGIKDYIDSMVQFYVNTYEPYLNLLRECMLIFTVEDLEAIEELFKSPYPVPEYPQYPIQIEWELVLDLVHRFEENEIIQSNLELIKDEMLNLFYSGACNEVLIFLLTNAFNFPQELSEVIVDILFENRDLITESLSELLEIIDFIPPMFLNVEYYEFNEFLVDVDWNALQELTIEDLNGSVELFKIFLIESYLSQAELYPEEFPLTPEQLDSFFNVEQVTELIVRGVDLVSQLAERTEEMNNEGYFLNDSPETLIAIAKAVGEFYTAEYQGEIEEFFDLMRTICEDNLLLDAIAEDEFDMVWIDDLNTNIEDFFQKAIQYGNYNPDNLTDSQLNELLDFVYYLFPPFGTLIEENQQ